MTSSIDPLFNLLDPQRVTSIVDVGANPVSGDPPYKGMLQKKLCRVIGFEPQLGALAQLNLLKSESETYLPYVVGNGEMGRLRICRASGMTSLLEPDIAALSHFNKFLEWGQVIREEDVSTRRLDDLAEITELDFLKIDAQGSELAIFQGGTRLLKAAVVIQTEVSFLCLYKNQPPFGEIDIELRKQGFVPHAFAAINKRMIAPLSNQDDPYAAIHQLLEADVVYVRDFVRAETMDSEQLKHLALIAHHCYRSVDLAMNCIHHLVKRGSVPGDAADKYLHMVRAGSQT